MRDSHNEVIQSGKHLVEALAGTFAALTSGYAEFHQTMVSQSHQSIAVGLTSHKTRRALLASDKPGKVAPNAEPVDRSDQAYGARTGFVIVTVMALFFNIGFVFRVFCLHTYEWVKVVIVTILSA